jgi:hypothetical protein
MAEDVKEVKELSESEKKKEDWMNSKWRPAMGWMYMAVCIFDFIIAPIGWTIVQFWETQAANDAFRQWQPLTLSGAGLFHMAMGAVLGLSAWGRTQEKLGGANNGGAAANLPSSQPSGFSLPSSVGSSAASSFGAPASGGFSGGSFGSAPAASPAGFGAARPAAMSNPSFGGGFGGGLDPSDPPVRNTRND